MDKAQVAAATDGDDGLTRVHLTLTRNGSILVKGQLPIHWFKKISGLAGRKAVVDSNLARMAGVNFAFGTPAGTEKDREAYAQEATIVEYDKAIRTHPDVSTDLVTWLGIGDRGTSSNTIVEHLTGIKACEDGDQDHPYDPDDLNRCRKLLEQVPELQASFRARMGAASPVWQGLVDRWDELCATMDAEAPRWREGKGLAPHTYAMMREIIETARPA